MRIRPVLAFLSGTAFSVALLTRCGIAPADGAGGDAPACQCPAPPAPVVKSGTRLKAIVLKSDDGAQQFVGWWDSKLGIQCMPSSADPSNPYAGRCTPGGNVPSGQDANPPTTYVLMTSTMAD